MWENWEYKDRDMAVSLMKRVLISIFVFWLFFAIFFALSASAECYKEGWFVNEDYKYLKTCDKKVEPPKGCEIFTRQDENTYLILCKEKKNVTSKSR